MTVARTGRPFDAAQREMLRYLAGQAAVSLENIELQELVSEEAVTDELTGLADRRRVRELLDAEVERAERFGRGLSLMLLSVDRLERTGEADEGSRADRVVRQVARILDDSSHPAGTPGRWGDDELAVILPETGIDKAVDLAERIRIAVEHARIPLAGSPTPPVTVSIGIAALARFGADADTLAASADAALERARARGGNRIEVMARAAGAAHP